MTMLNRLKIGLINVVMEGDYQFEQEIPLGLAHIGSFLRQEGYDVFFKQCFGSKGDREIINAAKVQADVYGFQLTIMNYHIVKAVAEKIKGRFPSAIIVLGGPYLVSLSEDILKNDRCFDCIVIGEGEVTTRELLKALEKGEKDLSFVDGLVWRNLNGDIVRNSYRDLVVDLDTLPFPARDFLENAKRDSRDGGIVESVRMVTSRGCVGKCSFCCVNLYQKVQKGQRWRGRSPKHVVDELEYLSKNYSVKVVNFSDSSFEDPGQKGKQRSREICEEIIRRGLQLSAKIYLRCETMRSHEDIELLKLYKKAGIDIVIIGVEAASEYELMLYEKLAKVEDNFRTAKLLKDLDLFYVLSGFIMFGPNSTMETIRTNIDFLYKFEFADSLMLVSNILMLIRDSKLYHILKAEDRVIESAHYWELPKYRIKDPLAERMTKHWLNLFVRFPFTSELNKLQVNTGNLVSRMTNPMNIKVLDALKNEYLDLRRRYSSLSSEFGALQYKYFLKTMDLVGNGCSDEELAISAEDFFVKTYGHYITIYDRLYNDFLDKVISAGFGLSGLVFKHFVSAMGIETTERVIGKTAETSGR